MNNQFILSDEQKKKAQSLVITTSVFAVIFGFTYSAGINEIFYVAIGMTPTQIGLLAALSSLAIVLQLPASLLSEKWGKRTVFLRFYTIAVCISFGLVILPLLSYTKISYMPLITMAMFLLMFCFSNLGASTWFAMLKDFTEEGSRGKFFGKLRTTWSIAAIIYFLILSLLFSGGDRNVPLWAFSLIFLTASVFGVVRVWRTRSFPFVPPKESMSVYEEVSAQLKIIISSPYFRRFIFYYGIYSFAVGLSGPFYVVFLKTKLLFPDTHILICRFLSLLGSSVSLIFFGRKLDEMGGKSIFALTSFGLVGAQLLITLTSAGAHANAVLNTALVMVFFFVSGAFQAGFNLATTDSLLSAAEGPNPAFMIVFATVSNSILTALGQVIGSYWFNISGKLDVSFLFWRVNEYTVVFFGTILIVLVLSVIRSFSRE